MILGEEEDIQFADEDADDVDFDLANIELGFDSDDEGNAEKNGLVKIPEAVEEEEPDLDAIEVDENRMVSIVNTKATEEESEAGTSTGKRLGSIVDDEISREKLEDTKDMLLEAVGSMTAAIADLNSVKGVKDKNKKLLDKVNSLLGESSQKIADSCILIEEIEAEKKSQLKNMESI